MVKINRLELENVKRIKAVKIEPTPNGLTIIGGRNNQGKTSVLDSIAWALGGDRFRPAQAAREGSVIPPHLHITLSNGLVVERTGKNSDLKVIDPNGNRAGQTLLNEFVEQLALDLPKFMSAGTKEKTEVLLGIIGVGDRLKMLDESEASAYSRRHTIGQIADQKEKFAKEQPHYADAPKDLVSPSELIRQQQDILARNGENQRKRDNVADLQRRYDAITAQIEDAQIRLAQMKQSQSALMEDLATAKIPLDQLVDASTTHLEDNIRNIDEINRRVRANMDKEKAEADAAEYRIQYSELTAEIDAIRRQRQDLLAGAKLPLPGLSVEDGELTYNGMKWGNMSGSDQLKVSTAIVRAINPKCGFVLLDKLEQMDMDSLCEFGAWMEAEGLQGIATRVSTGGECSIVIEDGYAEGGDGDPVAGIPTTESPQSWKAGEF